MKRAIVLLLMLLTVSPVVGAGELGSPLFLFYQGYHSAREGRYDEAIEHYKDALSLDPNSAAIKTEMALLYATKGELDKAATLLKESLASPSKNRRALLLLARIYLTKNELDKAKDLYQQCVALNDDDTEAYLFLGSILSEQKKFREAAETFEKVLSYDDENIMALYQAGRMRSAVKDFEKARAYFEKILALKPSFDIGREDFSVRENIGFLYLEEERYDDAIREFALVLATNPKQERVRIYLAMALQEKGDVRGAIAELLKVDPKSPEYPVAVRGLPSLYIKAGLIDEGIARLTGMLEKDGKRVESSIAVSVLYEEKPDLDKGIAVLEEARQIAPKNTELLYQLGSLYEKRGDNKTALTCMETILSLEPDNAGALNFIGYTYAEKGINLDKAEEMVKKAVEKKPEDGYIRDSLGWVYYRKGQYEKALDELLKATEFVPDDPVICEHLGDIYTKLGQYDKARTAFEKSLNIEKKEDRKKLLEEKLKSLRQYKR